MNLIINVFNELIQTMQAALKYFSFKKNKTEETSTIRLKVEFFFTDFLFQLHKIYSYCLIEMFCMTVFILAGNRTEYESGMQVSWCVWIMRAANLLASNGTFPGSRGDN